MIFLKLPGRNWNSFKYMSHRCSLNYWTEKNIQFTKFKFKCTSTTIPLIRNKDEINTLESFDRDTGIPTYLSHRITDSFLRIVKLNNKICVSIYWLHVKFLIFTIFVYEGGRAIYSFAMCLLIARIFGILIPAWSILQKYNKEGHFFGYFR